MEFEGVSKRMVGSLSNTVIPDRLSNTVIRSYGHNRRSAVEDGVIPQRVLRVIVKRTEGNTFQLMAFGRAHLGWPSSMISAFSASLPVAKVRGDHSR